MTTLKKVKKESYKDLHKEIEKLAKENRELNKMILIRVDSFEKSLNRFYFLGYIRFILIVIPIVIAVLYLVPVAREFIYTYTVVFEQIGGGIWRY